MKSRKKVIEVILQKKVRIGSFIHPSVIKLKNMEFGVDNIVMPFCVIEKYAIIGNYNFITSFSFISHNCVEGDNNFFSVADITGSVKVGNNNYFGIQSTVIPGIEIGNNNALQAVMLVDKDVKDVTTVFYRFNEKVLAIPKPN